jgi:hypothetical protein
MREMGAQCHLNTAEEGEYEALDYGAKDDAGYKVKRLDYVIGDPVLLHLAILGDDIVGCLVVTEPEHYEADDDATTFQGSPDLVDKVSNPWNGLLITLALVLWVCSRKLEVGAASN